MMQVPSAFDGAGTPLEGERLSLGERVRVLATGRVPTKRQKLAEWTYRGNRQGLAQVSDKEYKPYDIDQATLEKMRKEPMIQYGYHLKVAPVMAALKEAFVECGDPKIKAFVEETFVSRHLYGLCEIAMQALIDGSSFSEKVWEEVPNLHIEYDDPRTGKRKVAWDGYALVPQKFKYNLITSIQTPLPLQKDGGFDGYVQEVGLKKVPVPSWKAFVFPHNFLRKGYWGESLLNYVYAPWFFLQKLRVLQILWFSKHASPTRVGYAPVGKFTDEGGDEVDALQWLADRLWQLEEHITMALPSDYDERGNRLWDVTQLDTSRGGDPYQTGIESLEAAILRGMVLVEQPPFSGNRSQRSYYEGMGAFESYLTVEDKLTLDFLLYVNKYVVRQLVQDHFGMRAPDAYVRHTPLFSLKKRLLYNVLTMAMNAKHPDLPSIALTELAKQLNVPVDVVEKFTEAAPGTLEGIVRDVTRLLEGAAAN